MKGKDKTRRQLSNELNGLREWEPTVTSAGTPVPFATATSASPPAPSSRKLPWSAWDLSHIRTFPKNSPDLGVLLKILTRMEKQNIDSLAAVPPELVTQCDVETELQRPKSLVPKFATCNWYPQLTKAFILHLPNGFIGDNVVMDHVRYFRLGRWWLGHSWKLYEGATEVRQIDIGVSIAGWGGEAFQLFILGALPKLAMLIDLLETPSYADVKIVSHNDDAPTAQWFWKKLGLSDRIVQKPKNAKEGFAIHANVALFPQFEPNLNSYGIYARNTLLPIQRRLGVLERTRQDLVLYLERPQVGKFRSVGNNEKLLARVREELVDTPYELRIFSSSGDHQADMELVKRAKVIFGPHGGAFANLIFAQPGSHVIEFLPIYRLYAEGEEPRPVFWGLAQAAGLDYWTVEPKNFGFKTPGMIVDPEEVVSILRLVLDERR